MAHKLRLLVLSLFGFQREMVVPDIRVGRQLPKRVLASGGISEGAASPEGRADQLGVRIPQQRLDVGVTETTLLLHEAAPGSATLAKVTARRRFGSMSIRPPGSTATPPPGQEG